MGPFGDRLFQSYFTVALSSFVSNHEISCVIETDQSQGTLLFCTLTIDQALFVISTGCTYVHK